jgi:hypothetical protein
MCMIPAALGAFGNTAKRAAIGGALGGVAGGMLGALTGKNKKRKPADPKATAGTSMTGA